MLPFRRSLRALEMWLWTGPAGHFAGGVLDFAAALSRYAATRLSASRAARRRAAESRAVEEGPRQAGPSVPS